MQNTKKQSRLAIWAVALFSASVLMISCNNESEKAEAPKADTPAAATSMPAPAAPVDSTKHDSLPPVDSTVKQKPDGKGK